MERRNFLQKAGIAAIAAAVGFRDSCVIAGQDHPPRAECDVSPCLEKICGAVFGTWGYDVASPEKLEGVIRYLADGNEEDRPIPGSNYLQIHFTYGVDRLDSPTIVPLSGWTAKESNSPDIMDGKIERMIDAAHGKGMGVLLKPHLDQRILLPGQRHADRAHIGFGNNEHRWRKFFRNYRTLMQRYAKLSRDRDVEMLSFACELQDTMHRHREWSEVVDAIRNVGYTGKLLYTGLKVRRDAIGSVFLEDEENTWRTVELSDYLCPHFYGPLGRGNDCSVRTLRKDFGDFLGFFDKLARRYGKHVLVTETGARPLRGHCSQPWEYAHIRGEHPQYARLLSRHTQVNWVRSVVRDFLESAVVKGVFWWDFESDYRMFGAPGEDALRSVYSRYTR